MIDRELIVQAIGLMAAAATIAAFYSHDIMRLRAAAILANVLFIIYAALLMLIPVLVLHLILLPLNLVRLACFLRQRTPLGRRRAAQARRRSEATT
ncbi:MAG: hypothetical protein ACRCUE_10835 [Bosea sp. (in: a-proteobacteria)]